jgi:hypothetical protein
MIALVRVAASPTAIRRAPPAASRPRKREIRRRYLLRLRRNRLPTQSRRRRLAGQPRRTRLAGRFRRKRLPEPPRRIRPSIARSRRRYGLRAPNHRNRPPARRPRSWRSPRRRRERLPRNARRVERNAKSALPGASTVAPTSVPSAFGGRRSSIRSGASTGANATSMAARAASPATPRDASRGVHANPQRRAAVSARRSDERAGDHGAWRFRRRDLCPDPRSGPVLPRRAIAAAGDLPMEGAPGRRSRSRTLCPLQGRVVGCLAWLRCIPTNRATRMAR